jgi:predicted aminopeptidase
MDARPRPPVPRRPLRVALATVALAGVAGWFLPSCGVRYVAQSAYYEATLLASRKDLDKVLASGQLSAGEEQRLRLIPRIKEYGAGLGLASTHNYDSYALGWDHTIWNLSASDPLAFNAVTWWFPIVGRVPYLGFFNREDATPYEERLLAEGKDVHLRTAGAFSTLGWFRDPVLPSMLRWSEADLAETVFHELAHATLWVPGSVDFNESFASFVGEAACERYLVDTYGAGSVELADRQREMRDTARWDATLHHLYEDLDTLYGDATLDEPAKRAKKQALFDSLPDRIRGAGFEDPESWLRWAQRQPWNNARLLQFQTYNTNEADFQRVLDHNGGDLKRFIDEVGRITKGAPDPFAAMRDGTGGPPP